MISPWRQTRRWPELPYAAWADTAATLQLWTQIVGKIRLARTPWLNHSWHVALYVTARGLTTAPIPDGARTFQIDFDFIDHVLWIRTSDGHARELALKPMTVAEFYADLMTRSRTRAATVAIDTHAERDPQHRSVHKGADRTHAASYTASITSTGKTCAGRSGCALNAWCWLHFRHTRALPRQGLKPVHFFWGSFDLAVTRFSRGKAGAAPSRRRAASARRGGARSLFARGVERGLLAGRRRLGPIDYAAFYSYAYPAPEGFAAAKVKPGAAFFSKELGEFILPYDAVRKARDPMRR